MAISGSNSQKSCTGQMLHFIHKNFLWILIASYVVATFFPGFGVWIRDISFWEIGEDDQVAIRVSPSLLMLSFLLFNAALNMKTSEFKYLVRTPKLIFFGLLANLLVPLSFIYLTSFLFGRLWHNPHETQTILVGLGLTASMPIAGSSTAWAQNSNGNLTLSLGLVIFSTLLSPLTTPIMLRAVESMTTGTYSTGLHNLASGGSSLFLVLTVVFPSILGLSTKVLIGEGQIKRYQTPLKIANLLNLLLLNYSNASASLPQIIKKPDLDFFAGIVAVVFCLCSLAFAMGWWISKWLKVSPSERNSLMFGLGMNNNGSGLVLATAALGDHPSVMLPIIAYNLTQQLVAGIVDHRLLQPGSVSSQGSLHR